MFMIGCREIYYTDFLHFNELPPQLGQEEKNMLGNGGLIGMEYKSSLKRTNGNSGMSL